MRHLILLMAVATLAAADIAQRERATIADWAQRYPAQAVLAGFDPDPQVVAALQRWQDVLRDSPTADDLAAARGLVVLIGHANGLEGWAHRRMAVADAAVWEDPIGLACVAWHRRLYQRRCAEIAGVVPVPDEPGGPLWRQSQCRGERHAEVTVARAIQLGIARSTLPLAADASERVAGLVAAAQQALTRAEAGEPAPAAVDAYALGQAWQTWSDYQERMVFWGERLPGWRAAYTRAAAALLTKRLAVGPPANDHHAELEADRWQRLLDAHRMSARAVKDVEAFDQEFAGLAQRVMIRQRCTQAIAELVACDVDWLQAELEGDRGRRLTLQREIAVRTNALDVACGHYAVRGRYAARLAAHPDAAAERIAAAEAALARALDASERAGKALLAMTLAGLDRAQLDQEKAEAEVTFQDLDQQARNAADAVTAVLDGK